MQLKASSRSAACSSTKPAARGVCMQAVCHPPHAHSRSQSFGRPQLPQPLIRSSPLLVKPQLRSSVAARATKQQFTSFDELLEKSELPVLVDFYAVWCGPCTMLSPILANVASRLKGQLNVVKIDTDKYPQVASRYQIQALPTLVLFRNGKPVDRIEGLLQEQQLLERVKRHLGAPPQ